MSDKKNQSSSPFKRKPLLAEDGKRKPHSVAFTKRESINLITKLK